MNETTPTLLFPCPQEIVFRQLSTMDDPCWEWRSGNDSDGYGQIFVGGRTVKAHRLFFQLFVGHLSVTQVAMHRCDNPPCVNPSHLVRGSHADNVADCIAKGRNAAGPKNGRAKLSVETVLLLRDRYNNGASTPKLAKEMGMSKSTMAELLFGKTWIHVPNACKPRSCGSRMKESTPA